ncbi:S-locus-specific glycoprotein S6-like [Eucalyptus grandis]|uniref:S-locus-specific glycoprotein S6-like n=1 Tax=Eucalyptus grandis TaxID=71139 RepID=UPI00192EEDE9|nr:S-locus-specific glycoprotein S6-like [Eucalyptus grandis]
MDNLCLLLVTGSLVLFFLRFAVAVDTIDASQPLSDGETIASRGRTFELGFFSLGSSRGRYLGIWYKNIPLRTVVWVANRSNPINDCSGMLMINNTGDIVLLSHKSSVIWSTKTTGRAENPVLQLSLRVEAWVRGLDKNIPAPLVLPSTPPLRRVRGPEMKLGWDLKTGLDRQLSTWKSPDDPSPGDFTWGMANRNFPDVVAWKGPNKMALLPMRFGIPKDWNTVMTHHRFPDVGMLIGPLKGFDGSHGRGPKDADRDPMELDPPDGAMENPGSASLVTDPYGSNFESTESKFAGSE